MKVNVIKAKDEYAKSCGSLDWYDHINGMSARDVELEMEYVCEQVANEMLEMLSNVREILVDVGRLQEAFKIEKLIKQATEL